MYFSLTEFHTASIASLLKLTFIMVYSFSCVDMMTSVTVLDLICCMLLGWLHAVVCDVYVCALTLLY